MDILYLLIPLSSVLVLAILGVFAWALHTGQFDDLELQGRVPLDDEASLDAHQHASPPPRNNAPRNPPAP